MFQEEDRETGILGRPLDPQLLREIGVLKDFPPPPFRLSPRRRMVELLYDMQSDPGETRNLASSHSSVLAEHKKLLRRWEARLEPAPGNPNAEWWRTK
jgi:hypothetical protein